MEFAHEAQRNRQGLQSFQPILQRGDVVAHLLQIGRTSHRSRVGLGSQQFAEGRLSPLDAAGQNGFLTHKGPNEKVGIRQAPTFTRKPADSPVGSRKTDGKVLVPSQRWRQWGRHVGSVTARTSHQTTMRSAVCIGHFSTLLPY